MWRSLEVSGWGRTKRGACLAARPEKTRDLAAALAGPGPDTVVVRGLGRSYGDAAVNDGGRVVLTERLRRLLSFDPTTGKISAEAGVSIADLCRCFLPRGFVPPVVPGTGDVSLGGAVAMDVHGKNHASAGSFGRHVDWIDLLTPDGQKRRLQEGDALFAATVGGLGLTGAIVAIGMTLARVPSAQLRVQERRVKDLDAFLGAFAQPGPEPYVVGWIDAFAEGSTLGRGLLQTADFAATGAYGEPRPGPNVPFDFPPGVLNAATMRLFNEYYFRRVPALGRDSAMSFDAFSFPLDRISNWNRIYGRRGFHQIQCVLPEAEAAKGYRKMLHAISRSRRASFLAVIKSLAGDGNGTLSFAMKGITLALDFPAVAGIDEFLRDMIRLVRDHGGRVYMAKDSILSAEDFAAMYPRKSTFQDVRAAHASVWRLSSDMARRIGLAAPP
jgi:decaprenylphospho-beta-D-ribofuranose 2-oxidase